MSDDYRERPRRERTARLDEEHIEASDQENPRRTGRLAPDEEDWSRREPVNPGWRKVRSETAPRGARASQAARLPSSPQELQIWLQQGGWRYVAIVAALFIILLIAILALNQSSRGGARPLTSPTAAAVTTSAARATVLPLQPSVTPAPQPTQPPAASAFVVSGTGTEGLFLRADHSTSAAVLETLPEGTRVEKIGDDFTGPDRVWRSVRAPSGQQGWVAVDFLQPAP